MEDGGGECVVEANKGSRVLELALGRVEVLTITLTRSV